MFNKIYSLFRPAKPPKIDKIKLVLGKGAYESFSCSSLDILDYQNTARYLRTFSILKRKYTTGDLQERSNEYRLYLDNIPGMFPIRVDRVEIEKNRYFTVDWVNDPTRKKPIEKFTKHVAIEWLSIRRFYNYDETDFDY